ncbi:OmpA family protein [Fluviicola sp.]|uniref:OmpA family protein n=1 Tax=Fluviicola sp. TaxID=1917219 RepID=UPI0031DC66A5
MKFKLLLFLLSVICMDASGQQTAESSEAISDCTGAVTILKNGDYKLQFPGKGGSVNDFQAYATLKDIPDKNTVFCSFKASSDGRFTLHAKCEQPIQMIIFEGETKYPCEEIRKGAAEIKRIISKPSPELGLGLIVSDKALYPIDLKAGQELIVCFIAPPKTKEYLDVNFVLEPTNGELQEASDGGKLIDARTTREPGLKIMIRDYETGKPVISNMTITGIKGIKGITAAYQGSDFLISIDHSGRVQLKVDAEGYFFTDREEPVSANTETEIVVWIEPLGEGKSMQIDEIEFLPGTSDFLQSAEPKLRRLRDFLALNAGVKIEIQGHVHSNGDNTFEAQKLSEARAKRVYNYLVDNGIDKNRMTTVGFGNTRPIFPNAKFASEEQANRRVEIKVL